MGVSVSFYNFFEIFCDKTLVKVYKGEGKWKFNVLFVKVYNSAYKDTQYVIFA